MGLKVGDAVWISDFEYPIETRHGWIVTCTNASTTYPISIFHPATGCRLELMRPKELSLEEEEELEDILWE